MRLTQLNRATLTDPQRALFESIAGNRSASQQARTLIDADGDIQGPFNHMLHVPPLGDPVQQLGGVLRFEGTLSDRARELVILMVARAWDSEFEWWAHVRIANDIGISPDEIEAVFAGTVPALGDPVEQAAVDVASAVIQRGDLTDDEYTRATELLGTETLIELTTLVGYYAMVAMQMRVFRVDLPAGEAPAFTG